MDCNACLIDFKELPAEQIEQRFWIINQKRFDADLRSFAECKNTECPVGCPDSHVYYKSLARGTAGSCHTFTW